MFSDDQLDEDNDDIKGLKKDVQLDPNNRKITNIPQCPKYEKTVWEVIFEKENPV